jgi:hypothetical protein
VTNGQRPGDDCLDRGHVARKPGRKDAHGRQLSTCSVCLCSIARNPWLALGGGRKGGGNGWYYVGVLP